MTDNRDWSQIEDPVERTRVMLEVETGEPCERWEAEILLDREASAREDART